MNANYIIFAEVDIKTEEIHWVDSVKSIIDPLEYKKEFNKDVLDDFVRSLSRRFPKKEFPIINYSPHIIYAYDKYIKMEEFLERFRWYFEEDYLGRKLLTQQQKEFYQSLLLTIDDNCKEIKRFGEDLLGITLNVIFYENSYLMVGTKENEIMDYKFFFWDLGESQKEAKEHLVKQYLFLKYGDRDLPYQYTNKLNEVFHYYSLFSDTIYSLSKNLKLDFDGKDEFYESLYSDFRNDGGINTDSILNGYWAHKMVEQELKKYKSSGKIN